MFDPPKQRLFQASFELDQKKKKKKSFVSVYPNFTLSTSPCHRHDPSVQFNSSNTADLILQVTFKFHLHFPEIIFSCYP